MKNYRLRYRRAEERLNVWIWIHERLAEEARRGKAFVSDTREAYSARTFKNRL